MKLVAARAIAGTAVVFAIAGCGGGGNESGPPDELFVAPDKIVVNGPHGACAIGVGPTVYVYGGHPPYTLSNSMPLGIALDTTRLRDSGDGFTIRFLNGVCVESMPITIEDSMGRLATVTITNKAGGG